MNVGSLWRVGLKNLGPAVTFDLELLGGPGLSLLGEEATGAEEVFLSSSTPWKGVSH